MGLNSINILSATLFVCCIIGISSGLSCFNCTNCYDGSSGMGSVDCNDGEECVKYSLVPYPSKTDEIKQYSLGCVSPVWCEKEVLRARGIYGKKALAHAVCVTCGESYCNSSEKLGASLIFALILYVLIKL